MSFGGNLGEREKTADEALALLSSFGNVGRQSRWHYTHPLVSTDYDVSDHGEYLNFVFEFSTSLAPSELYLRVRVIEDHFGRDRSRRWLPRAADIDLLLCSHAATGSDKFVPEGYFSYREAGGDLQIPHAELGKRLFLLDMIKTDLKLELATLLKSDE
jgi:2-amino-4-hydroxy-6-hydroxymethyldihydropteridine diphosphokinase